MQTFRLTSTGRNILRPDELAFQPREEIPYKSFHPDLQIDEPLEILEGDHTQYAGLRDSLVTYKSENSYVLKALLNAKIENVKPVGVQTENINPQEKKFGYKTAKQLDWSPDEYFKFVAIHPYSKTSFPVSYDLDELDTMWLTYYNEFQLSSNSEWENVSKEFLEIVLTIIEREWLYLEAWMPKIEPVRVEDELDGRCVICNEAECENSNAIVFCDNCNTSVHQNCYGIPFVPEGQWFCKKCLLAPHEVICCAFCPDRDGAFCTTLDGRWCHTICAIAIPEISFHDTSRLDLVRNIASIPKSRWKLVCCICKLRWGTCVQCSDKNCYAAYHITCARRAGFFYKIYSHSASYDSVDMETYCDKHTPPDYLNGLMKRLFPLAELYYKRMATDVPLNFQATKAPDFVPEGPWKSHPLPAFIVDKVTKVLLSYNVKRQDLPSIVTDICKFYHMKRRSRKDAPLLKSQLLMDSLENLPVRASKDRVRSLEVAKALQDQYQSLLTLVESTAKRQLLKCQLSNLRKKFLNLNYFPAQRLLQDTLVKIIDLDVDGLFNMPLDNGWIGWVELKRQVFSYQIGSISSLEKKLEPIWDVDGVIQCIDDMEQLTAMVQFAQKTEGEVKKLFIKAKIYFESLSLDERGNLKVPSLGINGLEYDNWPGLNELEMSQLDIPSQGNLKSLHDFIEGLDLNEKIGKFPISMFQNQVAQFSTIEIPKMSGRANGMHNFHSEDVTGQSNHALPNSVTKKNGTKQPYTKNSLPFNERITRSKAKKNYS
ncbi:Mst2 complex subunit nto1 [Schizosaccharomyces pombe]|uniref:Mst2 complex subunit nto1 n=1 Tax=Schizosaccharomyces pombe (strain 972 / ATCC 24843) TaxID=284812 RepID=NTO1_SCHPO|nr:putative histone acetyltransferase complex subunit Nto1 [Schizosaccharomyces pombe]O74759.1 RecName: Full=Mst2 complex subunit nto1 [Schizosaccharomyces pombe 972h-]CAA21075.1 histone acetyltransferase complex subunit Nto1 (predicted) [Schizosaccharomyces pombe]|eukprot:NP_596378.1 putative histone acetyltransferase complex subunit Nto1 [Schizosaccharomyces pombe]